MTGSSRSRVRVGAAAGVAAACAAVLAPPSPAETYGLKRFTTPSGNISCAIDTDWPKPSVRCDLHEAAFVPPPAPADCYGARGHSVSMVLGQSPAFRCISDTVADPSLFVLQYGDNTKAGPFDCASEEAGVTCLDTTTGKGFRIAKGSYTFLP